jgi:hypothetical protein
MLLARPGRLAHQDIGARQGSYAAMASGRTFNAVIVSVGCGVGGDTTTAPDQTIHDAGSTIEVKFQKVARSVFYCPPCFRICSAR